MDTFAVMPSTELSVVHMDPEDPLPHAGDGILLTDLPPAAIALMVDAFVGSPLLRVEVRHLGGAAAIGSPEHGVLNSIDQPFVTFTFGLTADADVRAAVDRNVASLLGARGPWDSGRKYLNFAESRVDPHANFPADGFDRLQRAKRRYDPTNVFQANHPILDGSESAG